MLPLHRAHKLEHLRIGDSVEFGAEFEGIERVEKRRLGDFALGAAEERIKEAKRDALEPRDAARDFEQVGHAVAEDEERSLGGVLRERVTDKFCACAVVGEDRLEVALEDEGSIAFDEERAREVNRARQRFAHEDEVLAKVVGDDRRSARRAGVVARVGKAREPFEKDFELEEGVFFAIGDDRL